MKCPYKRINKAALKQALEMRSRNLSIRFIAWQLNVDHERLLIAMSKEYERRWKAGQHQYVESLP